jgi:DNA-binding CsgD family transcriptional regulator
VVLALTAAERAALTAAQRVLLSPHDYAAPNDWCTAASESLRPLFGHDRLQAVMDAPPVAPFYLEGLDRAVIEAYLAYYVGRDPSATPLLSNPVSRTGLAVRQAGREASVFYRSEVYNDYYRPNGMVHGYCMVAGGGGGTLLPRGRATLVVSRPVPDEETTDRRRRAMLSLLQPAFEAGIHALIRAGTAAAALACGLEALGQPLLAAGPDGGPPWTTAALAEALAEEPAREVVLGRARALLQRTVALGRHRPPSSFVPGKGMDTVVHPLSETVRTPAGAWRLRPVLFGEGIAGRPLAAIAVERVAPALPAPNALVERFGLTPQEARVALLLAERRRNTEVAEALGVRPATARRHTERVLEKLGVHSRDAVRAALLDA